MGGPARLGADLLYVVPDRHRSLAVLREVVVTGWYGVGMNSFGSAGVSVVVGVVLALVGVMGGVKAISPGANPASASEQVVSYDAP